MTTTVVHCKRDKYDVYIGRPSKWGNPFSHKEGTLAEHKTDTVEDAILCYTGFINNSPHLIADLHELKDKVLGCWCKPGPCHGDVLARLADES